MKTKFLIPVSVMLILGMLATSCIPKIFSFQQQSEGSVAATAAVQTLQAMETQVYVGTLVAELTRVANEQLGTQAATSETQNEANTPTPTETQIPATATTTSTATAIIYPTPTPVPCYWVQFIKDVTIPDGTKIDAGKDFTKTWRLKNIGSCSWDTDFDLVFVNGNAMNGSASIELSDDVYPGQTIDVSVDLTAPDEEGEYKGNWMLRSDNGVKFGLGVSQDKPFWVSIEVPSDYVEIDPDKPLNFAKYYQAADWSTAEGEPDNEDNYDIGSVYSTTKPDMEKDRIDDELTLIMIPSPGDDGYIAGKYPYVNIEDGDHLTAVLGCTSGKTKCDVTFEIDYRIEGESTKNLGSWDEVYDGNWTTLDIDLSFLADESVRFTLRVVDNGSNKGDRVFWLLPKIVRD